MIGLDAGIDEVEALGRKRRAGGQHGCAAPAGGACRFGCQPVFFTASMYLAEVPKIVMPSASAKSKSTRSEGWKGEPS